MKKDIDKLILNFPLFQIITIINPMAISEFNVIYGSILTDLQAITVLKKFYPKLSNNKLEEMLYSNYSISLKDGIDIISPDRDSEIIGHFITSSTNLSLLVNCSELPFFIDKFDEKEVKNLEVFYKKYNLEYKISLYIA